MKNRFLAWAERIANSKNALKALFWVSFAESAISPFPAYFLVMFILAHKVRFSWQRVALVATISSVLGGLLGYVIGHFLFQWIGQPIINFYNLQADFTHFGAKLQANEFLILLIAAMTPIPFKVTSIASGVFAINFPLFIATAILGRGIKFIVVSFLTHRYGAKMKEAMGKSLGTSILTFLAIFTLLVYFIFY